MEKNNKSKTSKKVIWTRILCIFLAFLMVGSVAYLSVQLIVESVKTAKAEQEAAAATTTAATTTKKPTTTTTTAPILPLVPSNTTT